MLIKSCRDLSKISQTINIVGIRINIIPPQKKLFAGFVWHWQKVQTKLSKTIFGRILLRLDNFDENCLVTPEGQEQKYSDIIFFSSVRPRDSGRYECQISMSKKLSMFVQLTVLGNLSHCYIVTSYSHHDP